MTFRVINILSLLWLLFRKLERERTTVCLNPVWVMQLRFLDIWSNSEVGAVAILQWWAVAIKCIQWKHCARIIREDSFCNHVVKRINENSWSQMGGHEDIFCLWPFLTLSYKTGCCVKDIASLFWSFLFISLFHFWSMSHCLTLSNTKPWFSYISWLFPRKPNMTWSLIYNLP